MSHVQETAAIFERRLRPIYENLEVGNNRKALQETEKLLKKHPNFLCARALKGFALLRLGRYEESHGFLQAVADEKPVDDPTLQVLSFCYKELQQLDKIIELYVNAVKQSPGNEELLAHLFISHVRMEDFKSQQSVALQLYKAHPKNAYYFWAVMSVVMQGIRGPESNKPEKRKIFLALAERMVAKWIQENKLETEQEVFLYMHILKLQENYQGALDFLNGELCEKLYPGAPVYMKIDLMKKLEKWQELNQLLKNLLKDERDRWDYYQDYLTSCFQLLNNEDNLIKHQEPQPPAEGKEENNKENEENKENKENYLPLNNIENDKSDSIMNALDNCHEFLCQLIETDSNKKVRGPYLARLELHKRMREINLNAEELLGEFSELVVEYFHLFGDKSCCTHDIALFLPSIEIDARQQLASKLLIESGISSTSLPKNKEQLQKHICALQISRICGSHMNLETEHSLAFYTALKLHYEHGLSNFGKNLLPTDMGPSDPYALLAANVMYDISLKEQKSHRLFEALCLLQYVLRNSTSNFHVKLLSLKIYHMCGCLLGAQEMYEYLDIKQIQLDPMGYVHCNLLPLSGRFSMARNVFHMTLKFFTTSYKDRLEYIAYIYRFCTFSKLEEFMNFKERLTNSLHYVATSVEAQLCDLILLYGTVNQNLTTYNSMSIDPADDRISWNQLSDNRDLSAIIRWDPIHLVDLEEERKESFDQEIEVLQIRSLILRLIASFIDLYHNPPEGKYPKATTTPTAESITNGDEAKEQKETSTIELLLESWTGLYQRLRLMNYKPITNKFLVNLLPTRLNLLLTVPYEKFFTDLGQLVLYVHAGDNRLPLHCKTMSDDVSDITELCINTINDSDEAVEDGLWRRREWQNTVAACIEILSLYTFVLSVYNGKLHVNNKAKSKKKGAENDVKTQVISDRERSQLIVELMQHLKKKFQMLEKAIQSWKAPVLPRYSETFMADMALKPEVEATLISDVAATFKESHELMVTELKNLIKDKLRMLAK